jgi:hypothetical protein
MTDLTEAAVVNILKKIEAAQNKGAINLRPTKLIVPLQYINILRYLPPVKKARGVRGRRVALNRRGKAPLYQLFKGEK